MSLYEKLPTDFLLQFNNQVKANISKGIITKNMYYELGLIIAAATKRGILLDKPVDFQQIVTERVLLDLDHG